MTKRHLPDLMGPPLAVLLLLGLSGCGAFRDELGLTKKAPDEFAVVSRAPLVLPPNYQLRPPRPGAPRPQQSRPVQKARAALFSSGQRSPGQARAVTSGDVASVGETALLDRAGSAGVDPNIRRVINAESATIADKDTSLTERLIFRRERETTGEVIDARGEAKRIRANQATGEPVTTGATPVIERREKGLFEGLF